MICSFSYPDAPQAFFFLLIRSAAMTAADTPSRMTGRMIFVVSPVLTGAERLVVPGVDGFPGTFVGGMGVTVGVGVGSFPIVTV
jgi:hypothetical protein